MNIKECIDTVDNLKPNQYTIKEKVMWLSFIEEIIINDVLKTHEGYDGRYDDFEGYSEDKISVTLIVPSPYDRLYTAYLTMKIDESNGETTRYNNSATLYNSYMMEYRKYYNKTHMPINVIGAKRHLKPQHKPSVGLSDAEYDNIVKDLTFKLTEYFSNTISPDKLYDIVMKYVQNNVEMLKGKDGRDGVDGKDGHTPMVGVDYFTENDKMEFLNHLQEYISSLALSEGDVTTEMIDDGAVTTAKIDDAAVATEKIQDSAVTRDKLAPDSVTGGKIKEGSVSELHIIDKNVTTKKLADGAVTAEKISSGAVTEEKIGKGAVTGDKIADKSIKNKHLSEEVINKINQNKFDGVLEAYYGWEYEYLNNMEFPLDKTVVYILSDDPTLSTHSGLLIVRATSAEGSGKLSWIEQTMITKGYVERRYCNVTSDGERNWSDWKSRYIESIPVADNNGTAGIVKLGKTNGLVIANDMLVVDPATTAQITHKQVQRMPITPTNIAYAVATSTHQSLDDSYDPTDFQVVHPSRNEATYFPTDKENLPVSYGAVKKAMPYTVDENNNAQFKSGISSSPVYSNSENVGRIHNYNFGVTLAGNFFIEIYSGDPCVVFNVSQYLMVTISGVTAVIPRAKFEYCGTGEEYIATYSDSVVYIYSGNFIEDYPQFADYAEEMPGDAVAVVDVKDSGYKIDSNGAAEFTSLTVPHMYLTSPDNSIYKVTVNNNGELETTKVTFDENGNEIIVEDEIEFE